MPFAVYLLLLRISTWMMAFFKSVCSIWATDTHILYRLTTLFYFFTCLPSSPTIFGSLCQQHCLGGWGVGNMPHCDFLFGCRENRNIQQTQQAVQGYGVKTSALIEIDDQKRPFVLFHDLTLTHWPWKKANFSDHP